ncbi:MAG: glycogen synthase GlgA [Gammaproteobacteria bacterium]
MSPSKQTRRLLRVLLVSAEVSPWMKTGGLADAVAGLADGLAELGQDVRILTPAYGATLAAHTNLKLLARFQAPSDLPDSRLLAAAPTRAGAATWLLDHPSFAEREGNPYLDAQGAAYADNALRFDRLCRMACAIAAGRAGISWRPDIVHAHDWHAGLLPLRMMLERIAAPNVFTVHNLAYQGIFPRADFDALGLPQWLWHPQALEFYGQFSFLKAGLIFGDRLTTVSPSFAREMLTPAYGEGLEGVVQERAGDLTGIINGLDQIAWNPADDPHIAAKYSADNLEGKAQNRVALRQSLGLADDPKHAVMAMVGRLAPQKGVDLLLGALPELLQKPLQLVVLGSGLASYEQALVKTAAKHPHSLHVTIGYDEVLAHRIVAGADMFLMPSRYEPCGLAQMEAMRYGAVPIVRACGGLADTVTDASAKNLADGTATGFHFDAPTVPELLAAVDRALKLRRNRAHWRALMQAGMRRDFSWRASAERYLVLYADARDRHDGTLARNGNRV